jgi:hypothetical protein
MSSVMANTSQEQRSGGASGRMLSIGYLGGRNDHLENVTRLLGSVGCPVAALPTSTSKEMRRDPPVLVGWKPASTLWRKGSRVVGQLSGTRDSHYVRSVVDLVDRNELDCVIAYWSTEMLGDLMAIKKMRPQVKLILNVLCHPVGLTNMKVRLQNWHFRKTCGCLDGLIMPGTAMREYLDRNVLAGRDIPQLLWPPYYSEYFYPRQRAQPCPDSPNLLFLGRMDYYKAQPSDDVRGFIDSLLDSGVHVYHCEAKGYQPRANRHAFPYMTLPQAEEYATAFDASLILYNLDACQRTERFEVTVFDRLVASVTAGIPIAIPAEGYAASKEYLKDYEAVITFASPEELAKKLADRAEIARLRTVARQRSELYIGEKRLAPLMDFLQRVVNV